MLYLLGKDRLWVQAHMMQGVIILGRNSHLLNLSIRVGEELSCSSHLPYRFEGCCMERKYDWTLDKGEEYSCSTAEGMGCTQRLLL